MIINDVVIGTDTVLVSFDDAEDDVDTAVSMSLFSFALWLDDDVLLMVLISSSDRSSSWKSIFFIHRSILKWPAPSMSLKTFHKVTFRVHTYIVLILIAGHRPYFPSRSICTSLSDSRAYSAQAHFRIDPFE